MGVQFITITVHSSKGAIVPCLNWCLSMSKEFEEKEPMTNRTSRTEQNSDSDRRLDTDAKNGMLNVFLIMRVLALWWKSAVGGS